MIFIDSQCPTCHGEGCDQCHGTGMVGSVSGVYVSPPPPNPESFAGVLRIWRLKNGRTFRELSFETGILPSSISEIENGLRYPTEEQKSKLEEIMMISTDVTNQYNIKNHCLEMKDDTNKNTSTT